jgi:hypothetical protein
VETVHRHVDASFVRALEHVETFHVGSLDCSPPVFLLLLSFALVMPQLPLEPSHVPA